MRKWINLCESVLNDVSFSLKKSEFGSSNWGVMGTIDDKTVCIATFNKLSVFIDEFLEGCDAKLPLRYPLV